MVRGDVVLRRLLLIGVLTGVVLTTLELLGPLRFAQLAGGPTRGTAVFGVVTAVSFGAAALGSAVAGPARRALRGLHRRGRRRRSGASPRSRSPRRR